ncbi:AbiH family protein [Leuconostoc lactis]|uniref:AbiH family protein n=1 Tax=Leuconostoc lactis TaxID=1246 RepID=UPI0031D19D52
MVQIAYLIGNGFDIHLGLESKYQQFYGWLLKELDKEDNSEDKLFNVDNNELVQEFLLHKDPWHIKNQNSNITINWKDDDWADFEASLLNNIRMLSKQDNANEKVKKQIRNLQQVNKLLAYYLKQQTEIIESKINFDICNIELSLSQQFSKLPSEDFELIKNLLTQQFKKLPQKKQSGNISFINFNYTFLLRQFINSRKIIAIDGLHSILNFSNFNLNSKIYYPNGNFLDTPELGIGTKEEIPESLELTENEINYLAKESFARIKRDGRVNKISSLISEADITLIYGLSLGESDDFYISKIMENLLKNENHVTIITYYNERYSTSELDIDLMDQVSNIKKRIVNSYLHICQLKNISVPDDKRSLLNSVSNRILVLFDHGLRKNEETNKLSFFPFSIKEQNDNSNESSSKN